MDLDNKTDLRHTPVDPTPISTCLYRKVTQFNLQSRLIGILYYVYLCVIQHTLNLSINK